VGKLPVAFRLHLRFHRLPPLGADLEQKLFRDVPLGLRPDQKGAAAQDRRFPRLNVRVVFLWGRVEKGLVRMAKERLRK